MCKANFTTLIHSVEAIDKYAQYKVEPKTKSSGLEVSIGEARRFRYRTTRVPGEPRAPSSSREVGSTHRHEGEGAIERERRERERGERERGERERGEREGERRERRREAAQQMSNPASDERRRVVYALGLWAQLPTNSDRRKERVRDISAVFFRRNPACTHRLVPWLTREFRVLLGSDHVQFMIQLVLSLISKINLDGEEFPEHLQPFLNTRTSHFLHELVSFARSPLSMAAYDHSVRYEWPTGGGRARDTWDPEATVNHTFPPQQLTHSPEGPSGLSSQEIQERLFHELTTTRWDDSPPFLHLPSSPSPPSTPILVHGSDSEWEEEIAAPSTTQEPTISNLTPSDTSTDDANNRASAHTLILPSNTSSTQEPTTSNLTPSNISTSDSAVVGVSSSDTGASVPGDGSGDGATVSRGRGDRGWETGEGGRGGEGGDSTTGGLSESLPQQPGNLESCEHSLHGDGPGSQQTLENSFNSDTTSSTHPPPHTKTDSSASSTLNTDTVTTTSKEENAEEEKEKDEGEEEEKEYDKKEKDDNEECIVINAADSEDEEQAEQRASEIFGDIAEGGLPKSQRAQGETRETTTSTREGETEGLSRGKDQRGETKEKNRKKDKREEMKDKIQSKSDTGHKKRESEGTEERRRRHKEKEKAGKSKRSRSREYRHSRSRHHHSSRHHSSSSDSDREYRGSGRRRRTSPTLRHDDADIEPYYVRDKSHRSRLYSDDYCNAGASSSSGRLHEEPSSSRRRRDREKRQESESPHDRRGSERSRSRERNEHRERDRRSGKEHSRSRERDRRSGKEHSQVVMSNNRLQEELSSIDEEIVQHKREVLQAMLRCERLKLLHRQLQGRDLPDDSAASNKLGEPLAINETTPTDEVVKQLAQLDRAIVDEKRRVLHVMKRIEEDTTALDT